MIYELSTANKRLIYLNDHFILLYFFRLNFSQLFLCESGRVIHFVGANIIKMALVL